MPYTSHNVVSLNKNSWASAAEDHTAIPFPRDMIAPLVTSYSDRYQRTVVSSSIREVHADRLSPVDECNWHAPLAARATTECSRTGNLFTDPAPSVCTRCRDRAVDFSRTRNRDVFVVSSNTCRTAHRMRMMPVRRAPLHRDGEPRCAGNSRVFGRVQVGPRTCEIHKARDPSLDDAAAMPAGVIAPLRQPSSCLPRSSIFGIYGILRSRAALNAGSLLDQWRTSDVHADDKPDSLV